MKVIIKETGEVKELYIECPNSGVEYTEDFIEPILRDEFECNDDGEWLCSKEDFEWWDDFLRATYKADIRRLKELKEDLNDINLNSELKEFIDAEIAHANSRDEVPACIECGIDKFLEAKNL